MDEDKGSDTSVVRMIQESNNEILLQGIFHTELENAQIKDKYSQYW